MTIITPTIGRKVWFHPNGLRLTSAGPIEVFDEEQALDATIVYVYGDRTVNLRVTDHVGRTHSIRSCTLRQDGDEAPTTSYYCDWMPYQVNQAKTSETKPAAEAPQRMTQFVPTGEPGARGRFKSVPIMDEVIASAAPIGLKPADIEAAIVATDYHVFPGTTVTVCMLTLRNGAKEIGFNYGAIDPAQQNWKTGEQAARAMAVEKVWEKEGYLLREQLYREQGGFMPVFVGTIKSV